MMNKSIGKNIFLVVIMAGFCVMSCVDHAADNEAEREQARLDSLAQAEIEEELFDDYIADSENGINADDVSVADAGVRFIVWEPAASIRTPEYNDLVSVHYAGKYLSNLYFDTTDREVAKKSDSLNYVEDEISFDDLLDRSSKSYEKLLDSLNSSDGAIGDPLFDIDRNYVPVVFNHTENGSGISPNFVPGFRIGLKEVMLEMELNSKALIMIPSAVAYGTIGTFDREGNEIIPPNTPILFEFSLVNIRP